MMAMHVDSAATRSPLSVSFEFFPPQHAEMEETLWASMKRLEPLAPRFVSVTYGADGSHARAHAQVGQRILRETALVPGAAPHLRRRAARARCSTSHALLGRWASATSSRCAAIRRRAQTRTCRTRRATPGPSTWCAGCSSVATSRSRSRPIPRGIRRRDRRRRPRQPEAQDRRGRHARDHAVLLRHLDVFLRFRDQCADGGHRRAESCRASCRSRTSRR